jgi:uncharacterized damage-inducible protein DinB
MIEPYYVRFMARYNAWQNESIYGAADTLSDAQRRQDLGAFFGSIQRTLSHLAWADATWLSRFASWPRPEGGHAGSADAHPDWDELKAARRALDEAILAWASAITPDAIRSTLTWRSGALGGEVSMPLDHVIAHVFNHQTHHRGQVHALLTRLGAKPGDTDLLLLRR